MKKLQSFFLSKIINKRVYDEYGDYIGKLIDIYVTSEDDYPRAIAYKIKKGRELANYEFKNISFYDDDGKTIIKVVGTRDIILRKYSYLLSQHLLDKQIIDINGKKMVKVHDLRIGEIAGEYKVIAVDTGALALSRRIGMENLLRSIYKIFNKKIEDTLIMWDSVESLEMVNNNLKLSVSYQKLSTLHPADLADIIEDMNDSYRKLVFESLDDDLAADTFEEIDLEVKTEMLEEMTSSKKAEIIYNMSKDEAADILAQMREEEVEEILSIMEERDAKDIRKLMDYKEETAGSIMNKDFISFNVNITAEETIDLLREIKPKDEESYYIYIVDEKEQLKGAVSLTDLIICTPEAKLKDIMDKDIVKVKDTDHINEAVELAIKYDLLSIPVVEGENKLCGTISIDDIIEDVFAPMWRKKVKIVTV
ncbi:CBS domain-containing protein [Clostridium sporogenes]|uniref:Magnesium transporter n=3 Tax=Clostridium TaxID=1485 RepID=A0A7X5PAY1_CLOSG|nr:MULTISPECIES: CBS domain-containing protein [Clostridium]AJD33032.1 CBS domain protein [Clostridium botulinum Prevot_594]AVP60903.1 CBS domain-containing protein [Clostridium botulinum]AKC60967.1 Mg/Co/Ni transporter MgtE [Clostridium sporogenes]AKJ88324.1 membrane protein [Clostridium sporogenes]AVP62940.1 CBS domain-containing protein [Clostridium botulinum]